MTLENPESPARRTFFRKAAARILSPVADYLEGRVGPPATRPRLRPPGAIEESELIDTCYRCGGCVDACPAEAIFALDLPGSDAAGTPVIDPDRAACVVCDGLNCTRACPSGALLPIDDPGMIRMGVAEVYAPNCVRSHDETCTLCVDMCPVGEAAIRFDDSGPPTVLSPGCVGCGVCQQHCPTSPKTIVVRPI